jgi:hypothetical protein
MKSMLIPSLLLACGLAAWFGMKLAEAPVPVSQVEAITDNAPAPPVLSSAQPSLSPEEAKEQLIQSITGVTPAKQSPVAEASPADAAMSGPVKIEAWLSSSTDIPTIANNLLAGFPSLEAKDQLLAVSKLVALVSDDRFEGVKRLLFDPKTSVEAKEFLFRDALSRADTVKLPLLLAIMQMPQHPCANDARETLKTQLGADYGVNYGQWLAQINEVLRAQK